MPSLPSLSGTDVQVVAERAQTPMTLSKLVRKSLGFVRLRFGGGSTHATEEKLAIMVAWG